MLYSLPSLTALIGLIASATATPVLHERDIAPPANYYLQTLVVGNNTDCGTNKTGLWVYSYHTGAGLGDTGLSANKSVAWQGYLNGTQQLFTYPNAFAPWPMAVEYGPYQRFSTVTISVAAPGSSGFFFNETGLQYNQSTGGWLACDWWHGVPQLFNVNGGIYNITYPAACSRVELYPVAI